MNQALAQLINPPRPPKNRKPDHVHQFIVHTKRAAPAKPRAQTKPTRFDEFLWVLFAADGEWVSSDDIRTALKAGRKSVSWLTRNISYSRWLGVAFTRNRSSYRALITEEEWRRLNPGAPINRPEKQDA